jgi:octaprenyl-diphosphate synthase
MKVALRSPEPMESAAGVPEERPNAGGLPAGVDLLARLEGICAGRGLSRLAFRLGDLAAFMGSDLEAFEEEFAALPRSERLMGRSAAHLLDVGGKRLRPLCVMLAARLGGEVDARVLDLAVAVELVHSATLLHDDVVDLSDTRRGLPTARTVYGNAASIFAGDWLLIEALRRVERGGVEGLLGDLFTTIERMIVAESLQLENRGKLSSRREVYFHVVEGKTASLFSWAMRAGGLAVGLGEEQVAALSDYGSNLGVAFQAVDDLLDLTGDTERTGKELFTDLREGKMTFPLIVGLERDPDLRPLLEEVLASGPENGDGGPALGAPVEGRRAQRMLEILRRTGAVDACRELARNRTAEAIGRLEDKLPAGRARRALVTVARAIVDRDL